MHSAYSQSIKITGKILSHENEIIAGSSVMLVGAQDSILKTYSITNKEGSFTLNYIKQGEYVLKVSFFGYKPYEQLITVSDTDSNMDLGNVLLQPKQLNVVEVEGQFIPIQIKGDTIEYDSRAFEVKEHEVVEDLLRQLPGVEVDENGTIKVQGEEVEQVLVDGEKFFGNDPTIATKNLPAKSVSKIQVFDKKSEMSEFTGVEDGSESPTINLKLKEDHKKGYFGNIDLAGGSEFPTNDLLRYKSKANVHYFKDKIQFSVIGMSNNINETGFTFSDYANFMGGVQNMMRGGGMNFNTSGLNINGGGAETGFLNTHATGVNFNYTPTKQTTVSSSFFLNNFDRTYNKVLERETYFTDSTLYTDETVDQNTNALNNQGNIHLEQRFDSTHFFNLDLSGSWGTTDYINTNVTSNLDRAGNVASDFNTNLLQEDLQYNYSIDADYRKKFAKPGRNTGGGISYAITNSDVSTALNYLNTLYQNGVSNAFLIDQDQFSLQTTANMSANWMWSEPITKNQLLQLEVEALNDMESRDKSVFDLVGENSVLNDLLSASGDYTKLRTNAQLSHKLIKKNFNSTLSLKYQHLTLSGAQIFTEPKVFDFILPSLESRWDVNKKSNLRLKYSTSNSAPTLNQLQPLPNNTNPSEIVLGNTDLIPEYKHSLNLRFRSYNQYNFTFFMASLTGNYTLNNIAYSQNLNQFFVKEIIPQNLGDEKSVNSYLVYGTSIHPLKTKFHLSNSSSISNGLVNLNGIQDQYTNYTLNPSLSIENIGKKIFDLRGELAYNYSINQYRDNDAFNNSYQNWNYYLGASVNLSDRWEFNVNAKHYFYPDFETNSELLLLNFNIACNFLESRKLQIYLSGNDLLNQNTGINQYYLQNIYEQETTQTLGRYGLIGLKYSFEKLGGK